MALTDRRILEVENDKIVTVTNGLCGAQKQRSRFSGTGQLYVPEKAANCMLQCSADGPNAPVKKRKAGEKRCKAAMRGKMRPRSDSQA